MMEMRVRLRTCSRAGPRGPGGLGGGAVQKVVSLQEAVEGTEDGGVEHDGQRDGSSSGQRGEDEAPAGGSESRSWTFRSFAVS